MTPELILNGQSVVVTQPYYDENYGLSKQLSICVEEHGFPGGMKWGWVFLTAPIDTVFDVQDVVDGCRAARAAPNGIEENDLKVKWSATGVARGLTSRN